MSETMTRLAAALADRYRIERELGQGGMATVYLIPLAPEKIGCVGGTTIPMIHLRLDRSHTYD